ncbi:LINE-1 type transposase domain-containing protein 1 [Anabarilius grahami]|uniref:LINE-1 type transposase domain-containing protein 1 n=1 Tax=Anabarilius grahami TaxID=495550 RepID=A0A3N0YTA3_ANAGA|nr:LINE-1 type transposase domain-containing protein 1 [Anabarilius grahami]
MDALRKENLFLKEKLDDLEYRSRRSNMRVVGIPEKLEGSDPIKFMTDFFEEVLGNDFFTSPLVLSRAHRVGPNPTNDARAKQTKPRVFLVLFHFFQVKHRILRFSRQQRKLLFCGHRVVFHEDFSADLGKKRAAFKDVNSRLYEKGVRFGLLYPARLRVTREGKRTSSARQRKPMSSTVLTGVKNNVQRCCFRSLGHERLSKAGMMKIYYTTEIRNMASQLGTWMADERGADETRRHSQQTRRTLGILEHAGDSAVDEDGDACQVCVISILVKKCVVTGCFGDKVHCVPVIVRIVRLIRVPVTTVLFSLTLR